MKRLHIPINLLLLAAFAFRMYRIAAQPLSGDEAFTVTQWGPATFSYLLGNIATIDPQPPVALLTYHIWMQVAGSSEFAVRFLSACFSLLAVAGLYDLARSFLGRRTATFAAFLCALSAFQVWHSQDARAYTEWIAFSVIAAAAFLKALPTTRVSPWLRYIVFAALSLQTFYLELFALAATNLFALLYCIKTRTLHKGWLLSQVAIAASFIPWLIYSKPQNSPYQPTAGFPNIPLALSELLFNNTQSASWLTATLPGASLTWLQAIATLIALAAILLTINTNLGFRKYFPILLIVTPIILIASLSLITHKAYFRTRYIAAASAPLLLLIAMAPAAFHRRLFRYAASLVPVAIIALNLASVAEYYFNPGFAKAPPWREIAAIIKDTAAPQDLIIQNYPDPALAYYYSGSQLRITLPATENPPPVTTVAQLQDLPQEYQHIWFIRIDTPFWDKQQVVANWLAGNTAYLSDTWVGGVRLYQYAGWTTTTNALATRPAANLGLVKLLGYRITYTPPLAAVVRTVTLEVYWQPLAQTASDLRVFAHLLEQHPDGTVKLWTQDDHPPQQGRLSTTSWLLDGTVYRDVYQLPIPANLPQATYQLTLGFYDPATSQRYKLPPVPQRPEPNAILITSLTLPNPK